MSSTSTGDSQKPSRSVCLVCRQRKVACDRRRPRCSLCQKNGFNCDYVTTDRRPGLRAGFVSQLEQRLIGLEARVRELELKDTTDEANGAVQMEQNVHPSFQEIVGLVNQPTDLSPSNSISKTPTIETAPVVVPLDRGLTEGVSRTPVIRDMSVDPATSHPGFDPMALTTAAELCTVWFEKYHQWFPILHQPSLLEDIRQSSDVHASDRALVIKAILAVTVFHYQSCPLNDRVKWSDLLRDSILTEAVNVITLRSIQSLLILTIAEYGAGNMGRFWNMIALCKRLSLQLGLHQSVTNKSDTTTPPQALPLPNTIVDQEERIRAYWMTEMLDSMSALGASWSIATIRPPPTDSVLPCSDSLWAFNEQMINVWSLGEFKYSSAFSLCNILVASELGAVHALAGQSLSLSAREEIEAWKSQAQQLDERLTNWREEFVAAVFRLINAEFAQEERAEMDPNIVLTNCLLNTAVIVLLQRMAPFPKGVDRDYEPWAYATNRCVYACENMVAKIRRVTDDELRICNPHLVLTIFTAARFYLVYSKALDANVPTDLYSLAYALNICGQRWELAQRYETIIRIGIAEHKTPVELSSLPHQLFDLRYSALDLENTLSLWYRNLSPSVAAMTEFLLPHNIDMN